jgi:O-acetyl-ADP-ribose deacetylase (regulator of RNase III)
MKYVEGNLITMAKEGKFDVIAHGCNIHHVMGAGIALQIAHEFPEMLEADLRTPCHDLRKLGCLSWEFVSSTPNVFIGVNLYTQILGDPNGKNLRMDALEKAFMQLYIEYGWSDELKIGIPQIGAGLAGGDWKEIESVIDSFGFKDLTCVIYKP